MNSHTNTIYIVDDDSSIRDVMQIILEEKGYDVVLFSDEQSFLKAIDKKTPNLVFIDLRLAGSDGQEITKKLKSKEITKDIPIIIVSALSETKDLASKAGADDFLEKPFEIDHLLTKVSHYLQ